MHYFNVPKGGTRCCMHEMRPIEAATYAVFFPEKKLHTAYQNIREA